MLTFSELKELAAITPDKKLFISLYLNVNPLTNPKGDYLIHYKNMAKETFEKGEKDVGKKAKKALVKIESHLKANKKQFKKGIALICSADLELWKNYNLSVPVKNELIVDNTPYIKPLLFLLNNYPRSAVLLVDRELAKIYIVHMGEIQEYTQLFTPDIPGRHKKGDWFSLSQKRFERHIDYHVNLHIKDVIKALEDFLHRESINNIIVGGSEDAIIRIKNSLPQTILKKVVSTFNAEMFLNDKEVLDKTSQMLDELEHGKEKSIVEELIARTMKNDLAIIGIEDVLRSLHEGKVLELVFLKDLQRGGFKCSNCNFLTVQAIKSCPFCTGKFEEIHYVIDYAAQKAVEQGALIEVISKSDELLRSGGIGAFLRF